MLVIHWSAVVSTPPDVRRGDHPSVILVPLGLYVRVKVTALEYFIKVRTRLILGNDMEKDLARSVLKLIGWQPLRNYLKIKDPQSS